MRSKTVGFIALVLLMVFTTPLFAQTEIEAGGAGDDYRYLEFGGVRIPVPSTTPTEPEVIAPSHGSSQGSGPTETYAVGRDSSRTMVNEDGEEVVIQQSTRVSAVTQSTARERFNWFYSAREVYAGVIPLIRNSLPHTSTLQRRGEDPSSPNEVTWIGFEVLSDRTRVFVQLARFPSYHVEEFEDGQVVVIVLDNTRLSLSNWTRFVDTSYFNRSVEMIDAEQLPDQRARVVIWRTGDESYSVTTESDFIFVDFQDVGRR